MNKSDTEKNSADNKWERAKYHLAAIVTSSDDAIISKNLNGIITSWNLSAEKILGYTAKEAIGRHITFIIPPDLRSEEDQIISKIKKGERIEHFETKRLKKDGSLVDLSLTISPVVDDTGTIIGASKIARDITNHKIAEKKLKDSERQLQLITDSIPVLVSFVDKNERYGFNNKTYEEWFGHKRSEVTGKHMKDVIGEEAYKAVYPYVRQALSGKQAIFETNLSYKDAGEKYVMVNYIPSISEDNEVLGFYALVNDITDRKELDQRKDDFISMASHELKTPLTSVKALAQILQKTDGRKRKLRKLYLDKMNVQIDRLSELVADLLDISKIEKGKLQFRFTHFDFDALVADTIETINQTTNTHKITLKGRTRKKIYADSDRIGQVIINLLNNAIKYSPAAEKISVTISSDGENVTCAVEDFGIGISRKDQLKVFERFYRVVDTSDRTYPGLGVGLYISQQIIKRHGGKLKVNSRKGRGSIFTFMLPSEAVDKG